MALDFGILQPANISGQIQAGQESAMRNQLAQQQLATGQMQQEKAGLELQQFKRRQAALDQFLVQAEKGGQTGDPEEVAQNFYKFAVTSGEPQVVMAAQQALIAAKERKAYRTSRTPGAPVAAPAMPVAPGALGSGTFDLNAPRPAPAANMLAPAPAPAAAAPANALAMPDTKAIEDKIFTLETQFANVPEAQKEAAMLKERLKELYTPRVVGRSLVVGNRPVYTEPERPFAPPSSIAEFERARTDPAFMRFLQDRAAATRAPIQPVAPTITQIVDPSDPNKMITVDARRYQGGGAGSPGVIGVSGKEPSAALRENKAEAGKTQLQNIIEDVRAHYDQLNQAGDIPSTQRGALSNIASSAQSSALGQFGGRVVGTESQRARENIKSSRLMLLNALKQATGKSAQELNSNVELKTNLDALSDPTQGYEAAMDILNKLEDVYVRGVAPAKARAAAPSTQTPAAAPNIDALLQKYKSR